jgi:hypothetical protein
LRIQRTLNIAQSLYGCQFGASVDTGGAATDGQILLRNEAEIPVCRAALNIESQKAKSPPNSRKRRAIRTGYLVS